MAAQKKPAAKKPVPGKGKPAAKRKPAAKSRASVPDLSNLVVLTRERIEEVVEDAVSRGSMTRDAATDLVSGLVERGRRQTSDVLSDLEQLLGRARGASDQVIAQADRARRAAGVGPSFPIIGYDDLNAAQVQTRLGTLTAAQLRKVRDYEKRNAKRKSVLSAIESKLD